MREGADPGRRAPAGAGSTRSAAAPLLAVLGLVVLAVAAVVALLEIESTSGEARRREAQVSAEREAGLVQARLGELQAAVVRTAPSACAPDPEGPGGAVTRSGAAAVRCVPRQDGAAGGAELPGELRALLADRGVRAALSRARDDRQPVLSPPTGVDGRSLLAAPVFDVRGVLSNHPSSAELDVVRREHLGHLVSVVDPRSLVTDLAEPWQLEDGGTVVAGAPALDGDTVEADVSALDRRWVLRTEVGSAPWWWPTPLAVAALILLGAVLLGLADRQRRRELQAHVDATHRAETRAGAVDALAGIVQQSPDLDRILPALAVQLSDELDLAGVSLSVAAAGGEQREVFLHGVHPDRSVHPSTSAVPPIPPGATHAVDLHRADRSIAVLRVVAGSPIDAGGLEVLRLAGEMVTSTVVASRSIEQQQEAVRRLESLDELKTAFLGIASHELRTPATAIAGLATLLAQRWDDLPEGERRTFAGRIATNADALNALVQDLLDFARLERGDLELSLRPVDLSTVVEGLLARLETVWGDHHVEPVTTPGVTVVGDPNAIERIVTNLVSNAVKFSPKGSTVTVTVEREGDRALVCVDDAGPGVPIDEREKIFVRFFRGAGDPVVRTRGVGIGLSVVQDFVVQMGGTVRVGDSPAGGARFVVELPAHDRAREETPDAATT